MWDQHSIELLAGARPFMKVFKELESLPRKFRANLEFWIFNWASDVFSQYTQTYSNTYAPPAVFPCQSLGTSAGFLWPLYQLLIYAICGHLRYVVSAAWNVYFRYVRLGWLGYETVGVFATWDLWSLQLWETLIVPALWELRFTSSMTSPLYETYTSTMLFPTNSLSQDSLGNF